MPVILRKKGFAFFFVMFDLSEPVHVHVRNGRNEAKFWVEPLRLAWNRGYRAHELNEIERLITENRELILTAWQEEAKKQ
ncbi:MAG: DUF4160 domain-containing protein [Caldilineaceae bacterium]|nr:DUF4160 domain-containing protein [Caldilineaceae bacterium]